MAHCPYDRLGDLEEVLEEVRRWPGVVETQPGIFYLRRTGFLHFHLKEATRWADARFGRDWGPPIMIPLAASTAVRQRFLGEIRRRYTTTTEVLGNGNGRGGSRSTSTRRRRPQGARSV